MIREEIVIYEVAKLAKEKGFREKCIEHYYDDTKDLYRSSNPQCYNFGGNTSDAPTQSLLQRWLREEKKLHITINSAYEWGVDDLQYPQERNISVGIGAFGLFDTYEDALEDALKYALENLV